MKPFALAVCGIVVVAALFVAMLKGSAHTGSEGDSSSDGGPAGSGNPALAGDPEGPLWRSGKRKQRDGKDVESSAKGLDGRRTAAQRTRRASRGEARGTDRRQTAGATADRRTWRTHGRIGTPESPGVGNHATAAVGGSAADSEAAAPGVVTSGLQTGADEELAEEEEEDEDALHETGMLSGRVLTPEGQGAGNATVQYLGPVSSVAAALTATTDAAGYFSIYDVPLPSAQLQAWDGTYVSAMIDVGVSEGPAEPWFEIELQPAAGLDVVVVDTQDRPLEKANVYVQKESGTELVASQQTDANGTVSFRALPAESCWIQAGKSGYSFGGLGSTEEGRKFVRLSANERASVRLVLSSSAAVRGQVVAESGQPFPGVAIQVRVHQNTGAVITYRAPYATSDAEGWFEILELPDGQVDLLALAREYGASVWTAVGEGEALLVVSAGQNVSGIVRNLAGGTVPGALVELGAVQASYDAVLTQTQTVGADGRFLFRGIPFLDITLTAVKGERTAEETVAASALGDLIELTLSGPTTVTGFVESQFNRAIPNAVVRLEGAAGIVAEAITDGTGRYSIEVEEVETWLASAAAAGYAPTHTTVQPVHALVTQNFQLSEGTHLDVVFETQSESGQVLPHTVANLKLRARELPVPPYETVTYQAQLPAEAQLRIPNLAPGAYMLQLEVPGRIWYNVAVTVPQDPVVLRIFDGQSIYGYVLDVEGLAVPDAHVYLPSSVGAGTTSDASGAFVLPGNYPGTHTLVAESDTHRGSVAVTVPETSGVQGVRVVLDQSLRPQRRAATLGVQFTFQEGVLAIGGIIADTYAAEAGLLPGDIVTRINGAETTGWTNTQLQTAINARPNTPVELALQRDGTAFSVRLQWTEVEPE